MNGRRNGLYGAVRLHRRRAVARGSKYFLFGDTEGPPEGSGFCITQPTTPASVGLLARRHGLPHLYYVRLLLNIRAVMTNCFGFFLNLHSSPRRKAEPGRSDGHTNHPDGSLQSGNMQSGAAGATPMPHFHHPCNASPQRTVNLPSAVLTLRCSILRTIFHSQNDE